MKKHKVTIKYNGGCLRTTIESRHQLSYYSQHYPDAGALDAVYPNRESAQNKLDVLQRAIHFMDRYDLVGCLPKQKRLQWLSLGGVLSKYEQHPDDPIQKRQPGWDHVSFWRRAGERAPCIILTEPYKLDACILESFEALASRYVLEYHVSNEHTLYCPTATQTVLWHRAGESPLI